MSEFAESLLAKAKLTNKEGATVPIEELEGKTIGLYFSAHWCPPCRRYTPMLSDKYKELKEAGKKLEVIFVSSDHSAEEAKSYYDSQADWLMLDFADKETDALLNEKFEIEGIPSLVLLDEKHELITEEGTEAIMECPFDDLKDYAEKKRIADEKTAAEIADLKANFALEKVFNDSSIIDADGNVVPLSQFTGKVLGFYFSAHWCPPCRRFTPMLAEKYSKIVEAGKNFDIIFISSDRDDNNAAEYFAEMPWKMLKYDQREVKNKLSELYEIEGIPSLILLDLETGKIITNNGTEAVMSREFDTWKSFEEDRATKLEEDNAKARTMPDTIKHASHEHELTKKESVYNGQYGCDICGEMGEGYAYNCEDCGYDAHPTCCVVGGE